MIIENPGKRIIQKYVVIVKMRGTLNVGWGTLQIEREKCRK